MLELAQNSLLSPAGLALDDLDRALARLLDGPVDFGDLYFQHRQNEGWALEDGIVKAGNFSIDQGVGVRATAGASSGFAYADAISMPALLDAAGQARAIARSGDGRMPVAVRAVDAPALYRADNPIEAADSATKVDLLRTIDAYARSLDPRIRQVNASLSCQYESVLIAASDGTLAGDIRPLVRLDVRVIAEHEGRRESGNAGGGGRYALAELIERASWQKLADEAVRQALLNLEAVDAPGGFMTVVLGPGWPGVLLHEAIGHGLEGDFHRKGISAFNGKMGERIATEHCTVVDDGTLPGRRGSLSIDDEGTPSARNVLIENGRLVGLMQDKLNARLMGQQSTGNGRRESFAHLPLPRMTNTYMLPGEHAPEDIIASVDDGIYAVNFNGGQVDITSGKFVFAASEAYRIRNGKVAEPIKGATLIGNGPDVLTRVAMVGNDLELDTGVGVCGKDGQGVPVGVGQPTLRIDGLTVGGTQ
ncbi:MAG: metalloprotease TldD [Wenzhouxiangellaceae bacterium]|nr:metalloprotease TldD [Wenzhouxiangellaceae bacterium]